MLRLVVHGGYGKTATTFLQTNIFPHLRDVLYVGKFSDERMATEELHRAYHALFPAVDSRSEHRARNSSRLIDTMGDALLAQISNASKVIVLLSNENLFDYANYDAELNQFLLSKLYRYLQSRVDEPIEFRVFMTIRSQKDALKSFYAYDYAHLKNRFSSFEQFLNYGVAHPEKTIFGGYHYDRVLEDLRATFGAEAVRFFIYERMKEDAQSYLQDILKFVGSNQPIGELNYATPQNVNSAGGVHQIRDERYGPAAAILRKLVQIVRRNPRRFRFLESRRLRELLRHVLTREPKIVIRGSLDGIRPELAAKIDDLYRESNRRLAQLLNMNLETYDYVGGSLTA